ncbi:hypothetical protein [Flaviaesturariibacter amylovorans]|uniref:Uncharacterized protein n=1 Tax=Flaviaesturariibacter amylovorans TaxID=1084520 RepID=A0ABP8GKL1_9BACT
MKKASKLTHEQIKEKAIREIIYSEEFRKKAEGIQFRNHIPKDSQIVDDAIQEVAYWIQRKEAKEIAEMYNDSPRRIFGLAVRILIWKCYAKRGDYPKHSLSQHILWTSNFQSLKFVCPTESGESEGEHHSHQTLVDPTTEEPDENKINIMGLIRSKLDPLNLQALDEYLKLNKKSGVVPKAFRIRYPMIEEQIRSIVKDAGIKRVSI